MNAFYTLESGADELQVIVDPSRFDPSVLMDAKDSALFLDGRIHTGEVKGVSFSTSGLVSLKDFLSQIEFEDEEACAFLHGLFNTLAAGMKNQPVILETRAIFLSERADDIRLVRAPLEFSCWIRRDEDIRRLIQELLVQFPLQNLSMMGFLYRALKDDPDFARMEEELEDLWNQAQKGWRALFKKAIPDYQTSKPVYPLEGSVHNRKESSFSGALMIEESPGPVWQSEPISFQKTTPDSASVIRKDEENLDEQKTVLLSDWMAPASLEIEGFRHPLQGSEVLVGRKVGCPIRLMDPSISGEHARLVCAENRWYIQDLKSANGTWLNGKRISRKMRLKEGMVLRFGAKEALFHEQPLQGL